MKTLILPILCAAFLSGCATAGDSSGDYGPRGGGHPYGLKVKGKKGFVVSPYNKTGAIIDVRGFPKGTQVTDPWTDKKFLVP